MGRNDQLHRSFRKVFWKVFDQWVDRMTVLAGTILLFITGAVCYTIGMRFLFTRTTIWIIPITEYALLWIVFLSTTWLLREKGHVITEILYAHLNLKMKCLLDFVMFAIGGLACTVMVVLGVQHMMECLLHRVTDVRAITVPKAVVFAIVPIGSLFLSLQFFRMSWHRFGEWKAGR